MAKKFKFRLEAILKIKTEKVEESKKSLSVALRFRYEKERQINELKEQKEYEAKKSYTSVKASEMQAIKDHMIYIENQIIIEEKEKEKLIKIENERRKRLSESMKEEKALLKLKEKRVDEHNRELQIEETNFMDEISTQQYIKKINELR